MQKNNSKEVSKIYEMLSFFKIKKDDTVLIHNGFKSLNKDGYNLDIFLDSLVEYFANGTIMFPTMSWKFVNKNNPEFYINKTPSNTGILSEKFRKAYSSKRSLHPTHSVASLGRSSGIFLNTHHQSLTPCCSLSPFGILPKSDAWILLIGCGIDCCTIIHHVEELIAKDIYCKDTSEIEEYQCFDVNKRPKIVKLLRHKFLPRNYWQYQDLLAEQNKIKIFMLDNTVSIAFKAKEIFKVVKKSLEKNTKAIIAKPGQRYRMM
tara:strand:- start:349 stop:1134 length:786 start_codon:yes stop_codon:yes gene_type:complete